MDKLILEFILRITNEALLVVLVACGPPILLSMAVGLSVSLFQAVTQLQEATLTFVPKMIVIFGTLAALGPWIGALILRFALHAFEGFPNVIH
ncbi:type III secretion system export apparatus subunit SctS [Myxococcota bacterium]|nr:type III secretion system export apparatus subunit SctS [Myxococcota bacterium]